MKFREGKMSSVYIRKKDIRQYAEILGGIFNIECNPEMVKVYLEEMGIQYLESEVERLKYIKQELACEPKKRTKKQKRQNALDKEFAEEE